MPGRVEALVVNHVRRGPNQMTGMGDGADLLNVVSGGRYAEFQQTLDSLDTELKVSIAASCAAAALALWVIFRGSR